jgi:small-conductance mechanosensitive channel
MSSLLEALGQMVSSPSTFYVNVFTTLAVLFLFWGLRFLALRTLYRRVEDTKTLYQWRKTITYATALLAFLVIGRIWIQGFQSVSTFLGLLSAGLAIALRDPIVNLAAWLFIIWRRPFGVGDRIQIGEASGDVIDIRIFQFSLMEIGNWVEADQSTGRVIHVPNGKVFSEALANYSGAFEYIWNEIPVMVTFESNWKKAKDILGGIAEQRALSFSNEAEEQIKAAARKFMIFYTYLAPKVYTRVADSGVVLTIRYLCDPRRRRGSSDEIWEDILEKFADCEDIDFAYPTTRFYGNPVEGKPQARAPLSPGGG